MKQKFTLMLVCLFALLTKAAAAVDSDLLNLVTKPSNVTITSLTNDPNYPWEMQEDGSFKRTGNFGSSYKYKNSEITLEMSCNHPIYITFSYVQTLYSTSDESRTYRDGIQWTSYNGNTTEGKTSSTGYILEPGTHTVKFSLSPYYNNITTYVTLKSIKIENLEDKYITINLSAPGTLGEEALEKVATLPDMKYLKLSGAMNADDWAKIKQMTSLQALDMTDVPTTEIPASAFTNNCFSYYAFPKTLKKIGQEAFYNRNLSGTITLPEGLEEIGYRAFYGNKIISCKLPSTVTTLGNTVFCNNKNLQDFTFNSNITIVPSSFLESCTNLKTVSGLENVKTFGEYCFSGCNALTSVGTTKPTTINNCAFSGCYNLQAFDFSEITTTGSSSFSNCDSFKEIDLPKITSLGQNSFQDCDGITKVTLSDYIGTIPYYSFNSCDNLKEVTLGTSVSYFAEYAFTSCPNINKIYCNAPAPPSIYSTNYQPFNTSIPTSATLYVPEYAMSSYKLDNYWSKFTSVDKNPNPTTSLTLSKALTLTSGIRITGTPDITINTGGKMTINGDAEQTVGKFLAYCQNDNTNSASIISRCANMTSTSSEMRYSISSGYWYFICMPFDVKVSDITATNGAAFVVRYYDSASRANGNSGNWKNVESAATLKAGQGYIFSASTGCWLYFPATDATHNAVFESTAKKTTLKTYATSTSADANWNLVGNPYLAYYDIYYMDYSAPITVWNTSNKTYSAYSVADDDFVLLPLQAFFVQKPDAVSAITFNPLGRQHNTTIDHSASAAKGELKSRKIINLTLSNGETEDATRVVVNPMATDDYDMENDASKMMTMETTPQLYTISGDVQYAINEGQQVSGKVQIGMWMPTAGTYTISAPRADADIQILDNGTPVTLPYTFEANEGTDDNRFMMVINNNVTGIDKLLQFNMTNDKSPVYDLTGRRVSNTSKGIYIINNKKVVK